ncbi:thiamine phosphate synthase [Candidatus Poribacteria bacterium]|nr:thiamine phosphate synthase [Candidatus Poribacteria bacterium]
MIDFKLYAITDRHRCAPTPLIDVILELLDVGVTAFQLREKDLSETELIKLAQPIAELCHNYEAKLFINTHTSVASDVGAAGIHLPANSESVDSVKATEAGDNFYVGCSVHSFDAAKKREAEGCDFVTYSPIYATASKPGYVPAVGTASLAEVVEGVKLPVFALGGITPTRVSECLSAGTFGVAVMSGVMSPKGASIQAKHYLAALC